MADNLNRNEMSLELGGEKYVLRASFEAISGIENDLGSIMALAEKYSAGTIKLSEIVAIVYHGLRGYVGYSAKEPLSKARIGEALLERGAVQAMLDTMHFPAMAMNGVSLGKPQQPQPEQAS